MKILLIMMLAWSIPVFAGNTKSASKISRKPASGTDCASQVDSYVDSDNDTVILCQQLYSTPPYIRLSKEDNLSNQKNIKFIGGFDVANQNQTTLLVLFDRQGNKYVATDANGNPLEMAKSPEQFDKRLRFPTYRTLFTLYDIQGTLLSKSIAHPVLGNLQSLVITSGSPYMVIDGCAMDSFLLGTWEGDVSARISPAPTGAFAKFFDVNKRVPLSVTFSSTKSILSLSGGLLPDWGSLPMKDGVTLGLVGKINNYNSPFTSESGTVFPALTSYGKNGEQNPFFGSKQNLVYLYRQSNMHGTNYDSHWVFQYPTAGQFLPPNNLTVSGMSNGLSFFIPAELIQVNSSLPGEYSNVVIYPHLPQIDNGNVVNLHPVKIGATQSACIK